MNILFYSFLWDIILNYIIRLENYINKNKVCFIFINEPYSNYFNIFV